MRGRVQCIASSRCRSSSKLAGAGAGTKRINRVVQVRYVARLSDRIKRPQSPFDFDIAPASRRSIKNMIGRLDPSCSFKLLEKISG